jgi:hypothetical protein
MKVQITFDYHPDDPDENDASGMSAQEYEQVQEQLMELGAENIKMKQVAE